MVVIEKIYLEGGNVVLKTGSDEVVHVIPSVGTSANNDDCLDNVIHLSNKPADKEPTDWNVSIDYTKITVPSTFASRSELLQELSDNYLNIPLPVFVENQIDLTEIESLLTQIKDSTNAIDENTDEVETKLDSIIVTIQDSSELNHSDLIQVISLLQSLDSNTDNLEGQLTQIITNTSSNATESTLQLIKQQTDKLVFIDDKLRTTGEDAGEGSDVVGLKDENDVRINPATEENQQLILDDLGDDGSNPPINLGTGIRGWLRSIYEKLLGSLEVTYPKTYFEPGGRLRTADKTMVGEYSNVSAVQTDLFDIQGTGTVTHAQNENGIFGAKMTVNPNEWLVMESIYPHYYSKGNGQFWEATTQNFQLKSGVVKTIGYYSASTTGDLITQRDGMYIESNGIDSTYYLCFYRDGDQVLRVPRNLWDDKLDGSGSSGTTIDWTKFEVLGGDFLWLGGKGGIFYIAVDNKLIPVYEHKHAGRELGLIMKSPNQPIRYEIRADNTAVGESYIYNICASVATEGARNSIGLPRPITLDHLTIKASTAGKYYCLFGYRTKSTVRNAVNNILKFGAAATTNDSFRLTIFENPIFDDVQPTWIDYSPQSSLQYFKGDTGGNPSQITVTGGRVVESFEVSQQSGSETLNLEDVLYQFGRRANGEMFEYIFATTTLDVNMRITGSGAILERVL